MVKYVSYLLALLDFPSSENTAESEQCFVTERVAMQGHHFLPLPSASRAVPTHTFSALGEIRTEPALSRQERAPLNNGYGLGRTSNPFPRQTPLSTEGTHT